MPDSSLENDLRAFEVINQRDVQAALAGDSAMMMAQWADDFVVFRLWVPSARPRRNCGDGRRDGGCTS